MPDRAAQEQFRMPLIEYLTNGVGEGERDIGDGVVIGYAMVLELITPDGTRGIAKITSDAGGHPLPYYMLDGFANALVELEEFDETLAEEEEE